MEGCGTDLICSFLTQILGDISPRQLPLFQVAFVVSIAGGGFLMGSIAGRGDREGFINGIMFYINVQVYNKAGLPCSMDEDGEKHIAEAKRRLCEKIKPRVPS